MRLFAEILACVAVVVLAGCAGRPSLFPNDEPALRKTAVEFAADAAKRHPFKADAPKGPEAVGRAQVAYGVDRLEIVNLSDEVWTNVEVWVNEAYVVMIPTMKKGDLKSINFQMLYDANGHWFPTDNIPVANQINKVDIYRDGKMYSVPAKLRD